MNGTRFKNYMEIVRPFIYGSDYLEYPFYGQGSCFLIRSHERYFVVTAGHVVDKRELGEINIPAAEPNLVRLPLLRHFAPRSTEAEDTDFLDIEIIEVDQVTAENHGIPIINHFNAPEAIRLPSTLKSGQKLVAVGIPSESLNYDLESQLVHYKRFSCDGRYAGPSEYIGCHLMEIDEAQPDQLASMDGFSGGPVLAWHDTADNRARLELVGIAIRGTRKSGLLTFVGSDCLWELLQRVCT